MTETIISIFFHLEILLLTRRAQIGFRRGYFILPRVPNRAFTNYKENT